VSAHIAKSEAAILYRAAEIIDRDAEILRKCCTKPPDHIEFDTREIEEEYRDEIDVAAGLREIADRVRDR